MLINIFNITDCFCFTGAKTPLKFYKINKTTLLLELYFAQIISRFPICSKILRFLIFSKIHERKNFYKIIVFSNVSKMFVVKKSVYYTFLIVQQCQKFMKINFLKTLNVLKNL